MFMAALPACMSVCPQKSEEGDGSPETGVAGDYKQPCRAEN